MNPTLGPYWKIPGTIFFYAFFVVVLILFIHRVFELYGFLRLGTKENRFDHIGRRVLFFLTGVLGQWCSLRSVSRRDRDGLSILAPNAGGRDQEETFAGRPEGDGYL